MIAITILNFISFTAIIIILAILLYRSLKLRDPSILILAFAFALLLIITFTNILEHFFGAPDFDKWEDILEIIFIPSIILSIHIKILQSELKNKIISERKFRAIFNNSFSLMGLLDRWGNMIEVNKTAQNFAGKSFSDVDVVPFHKGKWWEHSTEEQEKIKEALFLASKGEIVRFETTHYDGNNEMHYIDFTLTPIFNHKKEIIYYIPEGRKISQLKKAQLELQKHKEKLEELVNEKTKELNLALEDSKKLNKELEGSNKTLKSKNETLRKQRQYLEETLKKLESTQEQLIESEKMASLGTLTAGIAHEINNPLNFILGGITGLDRYLSKQDLSQEEDIKVLIDAIHTGIERISTIIKSLGKYSDVNTDNVNCDINKVLDDCLIILHNQHKNKVEIKKNYVEKPVVFANEGRLHQVFLNLLQNAIQSIDGKGEIAIVTGREEGNIITTISDNGHGIEKKYIKKIFDPFFTTKDPQKGTGLGLYISKKIITDYNGKINFSSSVGKGTKVEVILPEAGI